SVEEVQARLAANEALVLFLDTPDTKPVPEETFVWVVTRTAMRWVRSELGRAALAREVAALRCGLDYQTWSDANCGDLLKVRYAAINHVYGDPLPFDLDRAHGLYAALFAGIEDLIGDKRLLVVPSGALSQLPFNVLVTEPAKTARVASLTAYRDIAWLVRKHAVTVLPAVSSLKSLRDLARSSRASEAFVGFGDPLLEGNQASDAARAKLARAITCASAPPVSDRLRAAETIATARGGLANVALLRRQQPLPETAAELCDEAKTLGVDPASHVHLGSDATESEVKRLSDDGTLMRFRIVAFATHGVMAGPFSAEPGLILTPPNEATDMDDGFLSASEIAHLRLDADWVILSACNTASAGIAGGETLSGLARAFFYAGARSLLVSHWSVYSGAAVKLVTQAIAELGADPRIGRAEAMRRAMWALITSGKDVEAQPAFWAAPFVVVGEGGPTRQ
ncbi:MAG: CHAT domain-containing protein, partial [Alphaproteobacteria bacterium]|nr:CHAT domain-containing protein [Alphaproteobacteria bacterium]